MGRYIQGADGKMRGRIGEGKERVPAASQHHSARPEEALPDIAEQLEKAHRRMIETLATPKKGGDRRTVATLQGDMTVTLTSPITEETRRVYLNGQCFALATALAEQRGCDIAVFIADHQDDVPWGTRYENSGLAQDNDWTGCAVHAAALLDEYTAVDIDGERDVDGWREEMQDIHDGTMLRMSPQTLRNVLAEGPPGTVPQDYETAHSVARLIP